MSVIFAEFCDLFEKYGIFCIPSLRGLKTKMNSLIRQIHVDIKLLRCVAP